MDFTLHTYRRLLLALKDARYNFLTFESYCRQKENKTLPERFVILRHDVDTKAYNALRIAKIEKELGIKSSYYFRVVPQSNKAEIIREIVAIGHEIGYHYEDLSLCKGNLSDAIRHFEKQLVYFRTYYPVKTICMHGSPASKIDNRDIWKHLHYKNYGILGEPYFDIDYKKIFYITDTGRAWDGDKFNVRDKVDSNFDVHFHSTKDIIKAIENQELPHHFMINTHPHRWTQGLYEWLYEYITQNAKNVIKRIIVKNQKKS